MDIISPKQFFYDLVGKPAKVKLKWGMVYEGTVGSVDAYMNILLHDTVEYAPEVETPEPTSIGDALIRCNNILYIQQCEAPSK